MSRLPSKGAIRKEFVRTTKQTKIVVKSIRYADFIGAKPLRYVPQKRPIRYKNRYSDTNPKRMNGA